MIRTQGDCKDINIDALNKLHTCESYVHNIIFIEQHIFIDYLFYLILVLLL